MKNEVLLRYKRARWHSVIGDSSIHRVDASWPDRHTGFKAVSTGWGIQQTTPTIYRHSRVGGNPQGGGVARVNNTTPTNPPSPLMGEESKVRVNKTTSTTTDRHSRVGGNPQGGCVVAVILALRQYPQGGAYNRQHNHQNPLSLDGRGIKEPVPVPDTGSECEQDNTCHMGSQLWPPM